MIVGPEAIRRELVLEYWRTKVPTSEIAAAMGIDEVEVCAIINGENGDGDVRHDTAR